MTNPIALNIITFQKYSAGLTPVYCATGPHALALFRRGGELDKKINRRARARQRGKRRVRRGGERGREGEERERERKMKMERKRGEGKR